MTVLTDPRGKPLWPSPFGLLRTAHVHTLGDLANKYEIDPYEYSTAAASGGTAEHVPTQSGIRLAATGADGSYAELRTNLYYRYQPGKSARVLLTVATSDPGQANQVREWGYKDETNGVLFQLYGTSMRVIQRSDTSGAAVDTAVAQASWNYDTLDGRGPSGMVFDVTKQNIYEIAFEWLGAGSVQYFINGVLVHENANAGRNLTPYMRTANLPLSWSIRNLEASSAGSLVTVCGAVFSDGGEGPHGLTFATGNNADKSVPNSSYVPILSIRPKLTYNGITNRMTITPLSVNIQTVQGVSSWRMLWRPATLTGASWVSADAGSGVEYDVSATAFTGGSLLWQNLLPSATSSTTVDLTQIFKDHQRGRRMRVSAFADSQDTLTIAGIASTGTNTMRASLVWQELR